MSETESDCFGVVLIGRNEGERLRLSLESVLRLTDRVVYADSASTDGSVELARSLGATVVENGVTATVTAARTGAPKVRQRSRGVAEHGLEIGRGIIAAVAEMDEVLVALAVRQLHQAQPVAPGHQAHRLGVDSDRPVGERHVGGQVFLMQMDSH